MAPECFLNGEFTAKSDIYSFGVVIRQMLMGRKPASTSETVLEWGRRLNLLDASERQISLEQVKECLKLSISCTQHEAGNRPVMQDIFGRLGITETSGWSALGGINTSSLPIQQPSATDKEPNKVQAETSLTASAKGPGDTNPGKSNRLLETTTASAKCKMLSARSLQIANNKRWYWRWISIPDSRFSECAELIGVYELAVTGEVSPRDLSAGESYTVYLEYKLAGSTSGLKGSVQTSSLRLYGEQILATNKVSIDPEARGSASDVTYPVRRGDGWLELKLAEFTNDDDMLTEKGVIVDIREKDLTIKKAGLIVEGMEFRNN
ncbi:hypothetical protein ACQ4PT_052708 [Festuca glaucescens]